MSSLSLNINSDNLMRALLQTPELLASNMSHAIELSMFEITKSAREKVPQAFGTLLKSIKGRQPNDYEAIIAPGVDYASMVEFGTAGGGKGPPIESIKDWIKVGAGIQPNDPRMSPRDLAFVIARSIAARGTPAQPYLKPAFEENKARTERRLNRAIDDALAGKRR